MLSVQEATAQLVAPGAPFEMEEVLARGRRVRVWKHAPQTLRDILERSRRYGDADFLVYEDERTTFAHHYACAARLAEVLLARFNLRPGDRVAIAMRNYPEWAIAFWAVTAAGGIVVPLNAWWTGQELAYALDDSGARLLFADGRRAEVVRPHRPELRGLEHVVVARQGAEEDLAFADVLGDVPVDAELPDVALAADDDATIFYTSGTTGRPKGAVGTHRNICTNQLNLTFVNARNRLRAPAPAGGERPRSVYLLSVPFFHATGCHSVLVANTMYGGKLVIMHKWDAGRALELIERERVSTFGGVPAMVMQVLDHPDFSRRDLSSVRTVSYGGAPAPPELVRRIREHFPGGTPSNGYGLTETSSIATMNSGEDYVRKPDSVGPPVPVCDVKVVDDDGRELPPGAVGELWIAGPNIVRGYWNKPEATAAAFTADGWLRTGDLGRVDEEGFVYVVDRAKDMVIRGGENVYCVEVEAALHEHPAVADAAVIGIPHDVLGEEVGAVVQLRSGLQAGEDELRAFVADRLAGFKVPVRIWFRDEPLPRNPNGKVLKRELREELLAAG